MPFYDMRCSCGNEFNVMSKMKELEEKTIKCPECGSTDLARIYGAINYIASKSEAAPACPNSHICGCNCVH